MDILIFCLSALTIIINVSMAAIPQTNNEADRNAVVSNEQIFNKIQSNKVSPMGDMFPYSARESSDFPYPADVLLLFRIPHECHSI